MRFFNTAGPVNPEDHYCLPPLERFDLSEILMLIDQKKYFVLHAPRQTGKTSCLLALTEYLNQQGKFHCLYMNVEAGQAAREDVEQGMNDILRELALRAKIHLNDTFPESVIRQVLENKAYGTALNQCLSEWTQKLSKPLILIIDEIDSLIGDTLISVLRQIRSGYDKRPAFFPQSIILCGVRDVRDYRIHTDQGKTAITGGSAFNIKAVSLRLGNFQKNDVFLLTARHTQETGQIFKPDANEKIWEYTQGQPWLVNALAYEVCFKISKNRSEPVTSEMIAQAKENLILRRETHLDQLADKLKEERVRRVIEPIIYGQTQPYDLPDDDIEYALDLGLIRLEDGIRIANPIYAEIIPRQLTYSTQQTIHHQSAWYVLPDGRLDTPKLLSAFQEFFREHSEHWVERFHYKEAGPQLLMQAFLQRVVNSGGRIDREYGLGRGRTDLMVIWRYQNSVQKSVIELKILYKTLEKTISEGLRQTSEYMDRCGTSEGHLIIFDRNPDKSWDEKTFQRTEAYQEKMITIWGM